MCPPTEERQNGEGFPPLTLNYILKKKKGSKAPASFLLPTNALVELLGIQELR